MPIERTTADTSAIPKPVVRDWVDNPDTGEIDTSALGGDDSGDAFYEVDDTEDEVSSLPVPPKGVSASELEALKTQLASTEAKLAAATSKVEEVSKWKRDITKQAIDAELLRTKAARIEALGAQDYESVDAHDTTLAELKKEAEKYVENEEIKSPPAIQEDTTYAPYVKKHSTELDQHVSKVLKALGGKSSMSEGRQQAVQSIFLQTFKDCVPKGYTPEEIANEFADRVGIPVQRKAAKVGTGGGEPTSGVAADVQSAFNRLHADVKALWDTYRTAYKGDKKAFIEDYKDYKG